MREQLPEEIKLRKRIKLAKILRIVLGAIAVAFLVVAIFLLKELGWIIGAAAVTVVVIFTANYIVLDAQNKLHVLEEDAKRNPPPTDVYDDFEQ